jgi:hypothetical protein
MPVLALRRPLARLQIWVLAAAALGCLLFWGYWLVFGAGIGTHICEDYTYVQGGANPQLAAWCTGRSWRGWLDVCLLAATAIFTVGTGLALRSREPLWLACATILAAGAIWVGFALPQTLAGPATTSQPTAAPPTSTSLPPGTAPPPPVIGQGAQRL